MIAHPDYGILPFDGDRAFSHLSRYVKRGNRYYGAPKRGEVIEEMKTDFSLRGLQVNTQSFEVLETQSKIKYTLTNIVGRTHPERNFRVLLGTHWDTRLWAEEDRDLSKKNLPITGANDGTSGLAVLLELATQLNSNPLETIGIDF